jgi:hypothetical protein
MAVTPHTLRHGTGALTVSPGFYPSPDRTRLLGLSLTVGREQPHPGDRTLPRRKQTSLRATRSLSKRHQLCQGNTEDAQFWPSIALQCLDLAR